MRTAFTSLVVLAGLAGAAAAQQPAQPTTSQPPATVASPPVAPAPAPPSTAPTTPPAASAPAAPAGAPEAPAAPDPAANPTLPTEGDGAAVLSILQRVCIPAVKEGGDLSKIAPRAGMKKVRGGGWSIGLGDDRNYSMVIPPQGSNQNVCQIDLRYPLGGERPIITALNIWSFLHEPELKLQRNDFQVGADNVKRITMSWEHYTDKESTGLVFVQQKNADGSAMNARYDSGTVLYSERTFQ